MRASAALFLLKRRRRLIHLTQCVMEWEAYLGNPVTAVRKEVLGKVAQLEGLLQHEQALEMLLCDCTGTEQKREQPLGALWGTKLSLEP